MGIGRQDGIGTTPGGVGAVKADLARRVAAIEWRGGPAKLANELDQIRRVARAHGLLPALVVAQQLERALARGDHGPIVHAWLAMLGEAISSERQDAAASDTFAAVCQVRFAG